MDTIQSLGERRRPDTALQRPSWMGGGATGTGTAGTSATQQKPPAQPAAPQPQQPMTFAQMQQAGMARPAPPPTPMPAMPTAVRAIAPGGGLPVSLLSGGGAGAPQTLAPQTLPGGNLPAGLSQQVEASILDQLRDPSAGRTEAFQLAWNQGLRGIDDDFAQRRTAADEEMARRGIYDSTIAGGRLHDLNIGQRSAEVELADRLTRELASQLSGDRQAAIQQAQERDRFNVDAELSRGRFGLEAGRFDLDREQAAFTNLLQLLGLTGDESIAAGVNETSEASRLTQQAQRLREEAARIRSGGRTASAFFEVPKLLRQAEELERQARLTA